MSKPKILIDCDPGHDDAVAILYAARHLDVVALTTVHGNNSLENITHNTLALLALAGLDIPVAIGAAQPLAQPRNASAAVHGKSGLDGAELPTPTRRPIETHAVDVIIETARRHQGELILATIGPETNIALALRREPRLKSWVKEITVMGGSTGSGNVTPAAEFNIHCDPEAAWAVFNSGIPLRMVGLNVTRVTGIEPADIARLAASGRKTATTIAGLLTFYLDRQRERRGATSAPMHDACAIVPYVDASLIQYADARVDIELTGTHTRGMTVCEIHTGLPATALADWPPANAKVAVSSRARPLINSIVDTLLTYP